MQTIETVYHAATSYKGSKIIATASGGRRVSLPYGDERSGEKEHIAAALALCKRLGWDGKMIGGHTKRGMVWVFVSSNSPTFTAKNPAP